MDEGVDTRDGVTHRDRGRTNVFGLWTVIGTKEGKEVETVGYLVGQEG